jgi:uncharacterized protein
MMRILDHFSIPYQGMKNGIHECHFDADDTFFAHFEASPIQHGNVGIDLVIDKKANMSTMQFEISGYINAPCDRCLAEIKLPISGSFVLHVKVGDGDNEEFEVIFFSPDQSVLKLAEPVYEMIILSMPMINAYDCQNDAPLPCNFDVLNKINVQPSPDMPNDDKGNTSIWDSLKDIDLN